MELYVACLDIHNHFIGKHPIKQEPVTQPPFVTSALEPAEPGRTHSSKVRFHFRNTLPEHPLSPAEKLWVVEVAGAGYSFKPGKVFVIDFVWLDYENVLVIANLLPD